MGRPVIALEQLAFQRGEEALGDGVIQVRHRGAIEVDRLDVPSPAWPRRRHGRNYRYFCVVAGRLVAMDDNMDKGVAGDGSSRAALTPSHFSNAAPHHAYQESGGGSLAHRGPGDASRLACANLSGQYDEFSSPDHIHLEE